MTKNHEFASDKKKKKDEYYTKVYAILPLLDYLEKGKTIWCPFDTEESNYVKVFRENGFNVISGHIADGKDFFQYEPDNYDYIISNPPYSLRESILERLFKLGKPFAMLINISGLFDSRVRFNLFRNNPFEIMVFNKRVDYIKTEENNSSPPFSSIYLCNKILPQQFVFKELDKTQSFPPQTKSLRDFPTENIIGIKRKPCEVSQIPNGTSLNSDIMRNFCLRKNSNPRGSQITLQPTSEKNKQWRSTKMYKELTFLKLANARKKAQQMKKAYGYTPEVFKVTHPKTGNSKYVVVKPKGLKRV